MEQNTEKRLKYLQIMEDIKKQIVSGQILKGDKLPSENKLSAHYQVSRQTVRKAIEMLHNTGYVYAEHGRGTFCCGMSMHAHQSKNIAVVITYLSDYIFPRVIQGIDLALAEQGYSIILKNTGNSRTREERCLEELLQKDIDGVIIEPSKSQIFCRHLHLYQKLEESGIPYVFIQGCFSQMMDKPHVLMNDVKGGHMITEYLISLGHRRIAGVFKADDVQGHDRHKGYAVALQEAGIMYDPDLVVWFHTEDRKTHPYEYIRQMVEKRGYIDAVVCYNDQMAMSVVRAITDAGLTVPDDISVTGYDNSRAADQTGLKLTSIMHPQEKLGEMAAQMLLGILNDSGTPHGSILIEPELMIGNSCAAVFNSHLSNR